MKNFLKRLLIDLGVGVVSSHRLEALVETEQLSEDLLTSLFQSKAIKGQSKAQLKQDLFVLLATGFKRGGYFVEFGATNGVDLSNTYLLEKSYDWSGVLAEPAKVWQKPLKENRNCSLEFDCVWKKSGQTLAFKSAAQGEFSTIEKYSDSDEHAEDRESGEVYDVTTISLADMLIKHNAPEVIDYLSIDTEGSELDILSALDFSIYKIAIIYVEHNYNAEKRSGIYALLSEQGYKRRYSNFSKWDDWYYRDDLISSS